MGRRRFIGAVGAAAGGAVLADPLLCRESYAASAKVYSGYSPSMTSGTTVHEAWVQAALEAASWP